MDRRKNIKADAAEAERSPRRNRTNGTGSAGALTGPTALRAPCGWRVGPDRTETPASGGPSVLRPQPFRTLQASWRRCRNAEPEPPRHRRTRIDAAIRGATIRQNRSRPPGEPETATKAERAGISAVGRMTGRASRHHADPELNRPRMARSKAGTAGAATTCKADRSRKTHTAPMRMRGMFQREPISSDMETDRHRVSMSLDRYYNERE